jgi:hypothetical protein
MLRSNPNVLGGGYHGTSVGAGSPQGFKQYHEQSKGDPNLTKQKGKKKKERNCLPQLLCDMFNQELQLQGKSRNLKPHTIFANQLLMIIICSVFFFQLCDVAQMTVIHKYI